MSKINSWFEFYPVSGVSPIPRSDVDKHVSFGNAWNLKSGLKLHV